MYLTLIGFSFSARAEALNCVDAIAILEREQNRLAIPIVADFCANWPAYSQLIPSIIVVGRACHPSAGDGDWSTLFASSTRRYAKECKNRAVKK
jgi:hypothetical protein